MNRDVWSVQVTEYPAGSHDESGAVVSGWEPDNWEDVLSRVDDDGHPAMRDAARDGRFFWPREGKVYLSRGSAKDRARLLRFYGATAVVMRGRVEWEETSS